MPTNIGIDLHILAKKAKCRLNQSTIARQSHSANSLKIAYDKNFENYCKVVKMIVEQDTISDPISQLLGKDLMTMPDGSSKQRLVLETCHMYEEMRSRLRKELSLAIRDNTHLSVGDIPDVPYEVMARI